jgi:hypothetical protein
MYGVKLRWKLTGLQRAKKKKEKEQRSKRKWKSRGNHHTLGH